MTTGPPSVMRTTLDGSDRYVILSGGLAMPIAPILLLCELEARGIRIWREGDDVLVQPWPRVTDEERVALKRWKLHILALLDYEPPKVQ
jgi:hypothetical protein